ncbi:MAG: hypothetical protein JWM21_4953 [Acidobacteria bacterium]|nr:hypothetical protein [Acidobacteriota bacterium]
MKRFVRSIMAVVVTAVFTASAFGGDIHIGKTPPPPNPPPAAAPGEIGLPGEIQLPRSTDPVIEVALNLLQNLLSAF